MSVTASSPGSAAASGSRRATPLPADERRAAILGAVGPVLLSRGLSVTTKELAAVAGVAEGTIFRVFDDKLSLVGAAAFDGLDPRRVLPDIEAIDRSLPLRERLVAVMSAGLAHVSETIRWVGILHEIGRIDPRPDDERQQAGREGWQRHMSRQADAEQEVRAAVARLVEPDAAQLRTGVAQAVDLFDVVLVGASMRQVDARRRGVEPEPADPGQLVDLVLHGVVAHPAALEPPP
ncbi:TetR/AcrR family transcriptional regulator [Luteimicrobium subarcticum]|uniref:TetR family transcriptional regulator n=1 Tax=Luteimicrobium subarcticum TaxID=620910 RepID=A0A2M8WWE4_9MICO|nr:TetR/AcrR family transcriptional regulator [Luteimicrobium subarcticum]PJI95243.1 TetR family transcriptional regulator [Luteimicrobium subarcticum]